MLSKILFALVLVAALGYVIYHKITGRKINLRFSRKNKFDIFFGIIWLFVLAVAVLTGVATKSQDPQVLCYEPMAMQDVNPLDNVRLAWVALNTYKGKDYKEGEAGRDAAVQRFESVMDEEVKAQLVDKDVASRLALLHKKMAYHAFRVSSHYLVDGRYVLYESCYIMSVSGGIVIDSTEDIIKQLELLRQAQALILLFHRYTQRSFYLCHLP